MRQHYLDNMKTVMILLLFPYHTLMIWNNFGTKFYIWGGNNNILSSLIVLLSPWFMSVLFVIAGMSARYSLQKRNPKDFIKERIHKIFNPLISGLIFLIPFQTLYARKFFFAYNAGILDNWKYFFTHFSDLNGYDGMFTLGHLWFLLYLFLIALITLFIIQKIPRNKIETKINKINILEIILLFLSIFLAHYIGNINGQSFGKFLLLYLFGYYLFTDELIIKILNSKRLILTLFSISQIMLAFLYLKYSYYGNLLVSFVGWLGILSWIIIGKLFLDHENKITNYFKKVSFPMYIFHQTILVIVGYYSLRMLNNIVLQICVILFSSFIVTLLCYEITNRIPILKRMFGIR